MDRYILKTSSPALSGKAREYGRNYRRIAILKLKKGFSGEPKMISKRAIGVECIIEDVVLHVGKTMRSEGYRALKEMKTKVAALNFNNKTKNK